MKAKKNPQKIAFNSRSQENSVYQNKIASYREFLFLVNFAHRIFDPLILKDDLEKYKSDNKLKFYIGKGNNSLLVKSLLKRRFWWVQVDDPKEANFVWTQLKINNYYQFQPRSGLAEKYDKLDEEHPYVEKKKKKLAKSKVKLDPSKKTEQPKVGGILRGQLPENERKIFANADSLHFEKMLESYAEDHPQMKNYGRFETRLKHLPEGFLSKKEIEETQ